MTTQAERNELADKLDAVRAYTADELGADRFRRKSTGNIDRSNVILVSIETRDAVIAALRGE